MNVVQTEVTISSTKSRIEWLDFLRGVSALAVVLFHVRVTLWVGLRTLMTEAHYPALDRSLAWVTLPFTFFGPAVMLFFVVSGFAIHYPYAAGNAEFEWSSYLRRRFFRIYPPYVAAVVLTILAERFAAWLTGGGASTPQHIAATALMTQNYVAGGTQMAGNPSLWSLPVEVELYLMYPLLLLLWPRVGTAKLLIGTAVVSLGAAVLVVLGYQWPMNNFAKYWIIWLSGAMLAEQLRSGRLPCWRVWYPWLAGAALIAAVGMRAQRIPIGVEHFIWGGIYYLVVLWGLTRPDPLRCVPRLVAAVGLRLGRISYSLYLIHYPVFVVLGAVWISVFEHKPSNIVIALLASSIPIAMASLMWRWIEQPSQALGCELARAERVRAESRRPTEVAVS